MNYLGDNDLSNLSKMQGFERTTIILAAMTQYPILQDQKTWNMYFDPVIGAYIKAVTELGYNPFVYPLNDDSYALQRKIVELTSLPGHIVLAFLKGLYKAAQEGRISSKWWNPVGTGELAPYAPEVETFIDEVKNLSASAFKVGSEVYTSILSKFFILAAIVGIAYVTAPSIIKAITSKKGSSASA
jgi:hypothetical protein